MAALLLSACGTLSTWTVDPDDLRDDAKQADLNQEVDAIAAPLVNEGKTPGLEVGLLLPDGSTRFFSYGTTKKGGPRPTPDTLFAVGSLSKGFLAAIVATLVQDGRLSWDDTLASLLPPGTPLSRDAARITVEQLVTHTSGLPRQPWFSLSMMIYFTEYLFTGDNLYRDLDRTALLDYLSDFSAPVPTKPQYSNIGYGILGYAIECRTGESLDALLAERFSGPLGLAHTGYVPEDLPGFADRAIGHAGDEPKFIRRGEPLPDWRFTDIMKGSAAVYSTARDLLAFAAAHLRRDGSPLSTALAGNLRVHFPRVRDAPAMAWFVDDVGGIRITHQIGTVAGYTSYLGIDEAHRTAVVVLQNALNWDYSVGQRLLVRLAHRPDG